MVRVIDVSLPRHNAPYRTLVYYDGMRPGSYVFCVELGNRTFGIDLDTARELYRQLGAELDALDAACSLPPAVMADSIEGDAI